MRLLRRCVVWALIFGGLFIGRADAAQPVPDTPFAQEYRGAFITGESEQLNNVQAIAVDGDNHVWAATAAGLARVENNRLVAVDAQTIDGPAFDVAVDDAGVVWVAAWNGLYQLRDGKLHREPGLAGPVAIVRPDAKRFLATTAAGLFEKTGGAWKNIPGPWTTNIPDVAAVGDDLYVAAASGLYHVTPKKVTQLDQSHGLLSRNLRALAVDGEGAVWIASRAGIDVMRNGKHQRSITPREGLPSTDVRTLSFDPGGRLWVGTQLGAARYDGQDWSLRHSKRWLPDDEVRDVAFSVDGAAWIATKAGISVIRQRPLTLSDKADFFQTLVRDRHVRAPGLVEKCRLPVPGDLSSYEPMDTDNDGSYSGHYLVAECYRYAVTGAEDARRNAIETFRALEFLQTVTDTPGFVARTVIPSDWTRMADANRTYTPQQEAEHYVRDARWKKVEERWRLSKDGKWLWKGDTSSDEMTGHFYAYGIYYDLVADEQEKERVAKLVGKVMDYLIEGGYVLRDIDGEATRWGVWSPEKLNGDPNWRLERGCNSVEILSYLTVAKHVTGDAKYDREIEKLLHEHNYAENILTPMSPHSDYFTYIGHELLAMSYPALMQYETAPERLRLYRKSFDTWFALIEDDASPLYSFVYAANTGRKVDATRCVELLRDVPLDQIRWTVDNSQREDVRLVHRPAEDEWQTDRLLPASERPVIRWDRNVYGATGGDGGHTEGCSAFWLLPYWMGRHHDLIAAPAEKPAERPAPQR